MTSITLQDGEFQYYASPILVKNNQYYATLTNQRLIIEGSNTREFRVSSLLGAFPEQVEGDEPGLKLVISTPTSQKEMMWRFPVEDTFKLGEQQAWIDAVTKALGKRPFVSGTFTSVSDTHNPQNTRNISPRSHSPLHLETPQNQNTAITQIQPPETSKSITINNAGESAADASQLSPIQFIRGETVAITTAGIRIKHTYYTAYLTNLRLILQNKLGKIGREFAISELVDAATLESETGEAQIALSVGVQGGLKQMILVYPTSVSRDAWMQQLQEKLSKTPTQASSSGSAAPRFGGSSFSPAPNERVMASTPNVRIKTTQATVHLTNTRFVIDSSSKIIGEFAISSIRNASRIASELGEPGIAITIRSVKGEKEMHLIFPSMNERDIWIDALFTLIPQNTGYQQQTSSPYTVTTVTPKPPQNSQTMTCPSCGATNPVSESVCALCGANLHPAQYTNGNLDTEWTQKEKKHASRQKKERTSRNNSDNYERNHSYSRPQRQRSQYTGGVAGFIARPRDAFEYYAHEPISAAFPTFLITGGIWAVLTTIIIAYILPNIIELDTTEFPLFTSLSSNILLLILFAVILWVVWIVALLLHALITSIIAHLAEPSVKISEVVAMTMRCSLTFAAIGWIPLIGMIGASIWTTIETIFGLKITQNTSTAGAIISAGIGLVGVYILLFFIGGGFS